MYYLSSKNLVMNNVLIWSLPSKITCPNSTPLCRKHCYAIKAERSYRPNTLPCRMENLECSKDANFVRGMKTVIEAKLLQDKNFNGHFRIHESGDFYSQKYLDDWKAICAYFKDIKFLAFTKSFQLDYSNKPMNMEILMSIWQDSLSITETSFPISYTGFKGKNAIHCVTEPNKCNKCGFKCWSLSKLKKNVWGEIH